MKASHSGAISESAGRLAISTRRLVSAMACRSKVEIRFASTSTKASSSPIGERPIDVAVPLGEFATDVICSEQNFERAATADEPRQPRHGTAARHQTGADFPLRQDRLFPAGEAHIAGEGQLAADPGRPPANLSDRNDRRAADADKHVGKLLQAGRPRRQTERFSSGSARKL